MTYIFANEFKLFLDCSSYIKIKQEYFAKMLFVEYFMLFIYNYNKKKKYYEVQFRSLA